jgi:hypothetical protein
MNQNINQFKLIFNNNFESKLLDLIITNQFQTSCINEVLNNFIENPLKPELETTKIYLSKIDYLYSSKLSQNIKIIWRYTGDKNINLIDIVYI